MLSSVALAQDVTDSEIAWAAKSPYDLARFIESHARFALEPLWKALGIKESSFVQPCLDPAGQGLGCSTELIMVQSPDQAILIIEGDLPPFDVYLRFKHGPNDTWRFAGEYSVYMKNHPRRHEMSRVWGVPFLRVSRQGGSGSGIDWEIEDWIDLTQPEFKPAFSFTVQGFESRYGFGISRNIQEGLIPTRTGIDVSLLIEFDGPSVDLGHAEYTGVYVRSAGNRLSLQKVQSLDGREISNRDFESLSHIDTEVSNEQLMLYTLPRLKEVAVSGDKDAKEWLNRMLKECEDTPEKRTLMKLLAKP